MGTLIMMKLAIFIGVLATCALSASVMERPHLSAQIGVAEWKKRSADDLDLEKRRGGNSSECFVCPPYRDHYNEPPCYPYSWYCDGYKDCPSGIDEAEEYCGKRDLDWVARDIAENVVEILQGIGQQLVTDDYEFLQDVYEETRDAAEKINDVIEEAMEEFE